MTEYYIQVKPFGLGSRITVGANNLTPKGAVKKFKALGYDVTEADVKPARMYPPVIGYDFRIPTYSQHDIDVAKQLNDFPRPWQAKAWNYSDFGLAAKDANKAYEILIAADIDCKLGTFTYLEVFKETNSPEGLEFAKKVVEILRAPKKELK